MKHINLSKLRFSVRDSNLIRHIYIYTPHSTTTPPMIYKYNLGNYISRWSWSYYYIYRQKFYVWKMCRSHFNGITIAVNVVPVGASSTVQLINGVSSMTAALQSCGKCCTQNVVPQYFFTQNLLSVYRKWELDSRLPFTFFPVGVASDPGNEYQI
jgi:hypothetical protein